MSQLKIQVLVGMMAGGKSTYARHAAKAGYIVVNDDAIFQSCHGGDYTLYDESLKVLYKSVENHIASMALAIGRSVVIDRGVNVRPLARRRWLALARAFDVPCEVVVFDRDSAEVHARRRYEHDGRGLSSSQWLTIAQSHEQDWVQPHGDEGYSAIHYPSFHEILAGKVY